MANQMERPTGIRAWGVSEDQLPQSQRWISLVSMMITGLAVVFVVMKWNPILTFVGEAHGMGMDWQHFRTCAVHGLHRLFPSRLDHEKHRR